LQERRDGAHQGRPERAAEGEEDERLREKRRVCERACVAGIHHSGSSAQPDGYVTLRFEGNEVCPSDRQEDSKQCFWLDVERMSEPGFRRGRAVIEGTFDGENLGHLGVAGGTIRNITRLERVR
jgi:hypothetical protein